MRTQTIPLNKINFNEAVTLVSAIMNESGVTYKRAEAIEYLVSHSDTTMVLEVNDVTMGLYAFTDAANSYTLNFFALNPFVRKSRAGYSLYSDMANRLTGKPVIVPVFSDNIDMLKVVKKRGIFMGRFKVDEKSTIDYYSINFGDKEWNK